MVAMPDYTIQVDMETHDGEWLPGDRSNITDERDPAALGDWAADHHTVRDGADWRVRIWLGHDADPESKPVCDLVVNEYEP